MTLRQYLYDRRYLLLFWGIWFLLILGMFVLDRGNRMLPSNVAYLMILSIFLLTVFITVDFLRLRSYLLQLQQSFREGEGLLQDSLPEPYTVEQAHVQQLLLQLSSQYQTAMDSYQAKAKEDLEFVTAWVHEIKTPIAVSKLVLQNHRDKPSQDSFDSLEEELDKIERDVQKALYYARIHDFANDYFITAIDADILVKDAIVRHSKSFITKGIQIQLEELSIELTTDRKWMDFILDQLISNALKYTADGGRIKIWAEQDANGQHLHVEDTGCGIRPEDLQRVFNRSFTGWNGRNEPTATGQGLYLSRKLARKLGHELAITSESGLGTKVTVHFPKWNDYLDVASSSSK